MKDQAMANKRTLILDLGNVLINVHPERFVTEKYKLKGSLAVEKFNVLMYDFNKGCIGKEEFYESSVSVLELNDTFDEFYGKWTDIFSENNEMIDFVSSLKRDKLRIILASNTDPVHFQFIMRNYQLPDLDHFFLSYEQKCIKPEDDFFIKLIKKYHIDLNDSIFIDDLQANIESARRNGIISFQKKSNTDTIKEIRRFLNE